MTFSILLQLFLSAGTAQEVPVVLSVGGQNETGFLTKWDYAAQRAIFFRDTRVASVPAVQMVAQSGSMISIYPLLDLPGALSIGVWDVAQTPSGGVVFSAIAQYTAESSKPRVLKSLLMTYDRDGKLERIWDVYPYHHHHLAVAADGSVFALGTKDTKERGYPLLIKYSSAGRVLGEFLPASQFAVGDEVVESGSECGETEMFVAGDQLVLWLAPAEEILTISLSGGIRGRYPLHKVLANMATNNNAAKAKIIKMSPTQTAGTFLAQIQLWPAAGDATSKVRTVMAVLPTNGDGQLVTSKSPEGGKFLGQTKSGKAVYLEYKPPVGLVLHTYE